MVKFEKTVNFENLRERVQKFLAVQPEETFKCPREAEMLAWFNSLDDRGKQMMLSMSMLPDFGWEIPEVLCESELTHEIVH